jgi:hypothetical protein
MQLPDRDALIRLLDGLGDPEDAGALSAARSADRLVRGAGLGWADLLAPWPGDAPPRAVAAEAGGDALALDDLGLVERLLSRTGLSGETRAELQEFREAIGAGTFGEMDGRYLRGLAARLERLPADPADPDR